MTRHGPTVCVISVLATLALSGCGEQGQPEPAQIATAYQALTGDSSPKQVATVYLGAMAEYLSAQQTDPSRANAARDVAGNLVADETIRFILGSVLGSAAPKLSARQKQRIRANLVKNQAAIIAFYCESMDFDHARQRPDVIPPDLRQARVYVPARHPELGHDTTILVKLAKSPAGWRVTWLGFAPKGANLTTLPDPPPADQSSSNRRAAPVAVKSPC